PPATATAPTTTDPVPNRRSSAAISGLRNAGWRVERRSRVPAFFRRYIRAEERRLRLAGALMDGAGGGGGDVDAAVAVGAAFPAGDGAVGAGQEPLDGAEAVVALGQQQGQSP